MRNTLKSYDQMGALRMGDKVVATREGNLLVPFY